VDKLGIAGYKTVCAEGRSAGLASPSPTSDAGRAAPDPEQCDAMTADHEDFRRPKENGHLAVPVHGIT
jgi:hypothetical protein